MCGFCGDPFPMLMAQIGVDCGGGEFLHPKPGLLPILDTTEPRIGRGGTGVRITDLTNGEVIHECGARITERAGPWDQVGGGPSGRDE